MSQSISSKGIFPLSSGNLLRWHREDITGKRGGIRADFSAPNLCSTHFSGGGIPID